MRLLGIFGAGGFASEVISYLQANDFDYQYTEDSRNTIYFVEKKSELAQISGIKVISEEEFESLNADSKEFCVAIADPFLRRLITSRCLSKGYEARNFVASSAKLYSSIDAKSGLLLANNVVVTTNVQLGKSVQMNTGSVLGHHCKVGDFVTIGPQVHCGGYVEIGDDVLIGSGAQIRNGTKDQPLVVGQGAVIGMGAIVTKSVMPNAIMIGNPARKLEK